MNPRLTLREECPWQLNTENSQGVTDSLYHKIEAEKLKINISSILQLNI